MNEFGYKAYENFIKLTLSKDDLSHFKNNAIYNQILEHVSKEEGLKYLNCILSEFDFMI